MSVSSIIPDIMASTFTCTLEMINKNFEDHPDIRIAFYHLLEAIVSNCIESVKKLQPEVFSLLFNSLLWASKHTIRDVSDVGLSAITSILDHFSGLNPVDSSQFYSGYYVTLLQDMLFIITNPFHKPGKWFASFKILHII